MDLAPFNDEAIYVDWAYRAVYIPNMAFYSLYDAKQPFLLWLFGFAQYFFSDRLLASRFVSVIFGAASIIFLYLLSKELYPNQNDHNKDKKVSINKITHFIAPVIYLVTPIFLFFDRQALMESALFTCALAVFYFFLKILKDNNDKKNIIFFAISLALFYYIKSTALIFYLGLFFSVLLVSSIHKKHAKNIFFSLVIAVLLLLPMLSQEMFWQTLATNHRFALTIAELLSLPTNIWLQNIRTTLEVSHVYLNIFVLVFAIVLIKNFGSLSIKQKYFFTYNLFVILFAVLLTRNLNVRYLMPLFFGFPLLVTQIFLTVINKNILFSIFLGVTFLPSAYLSMLLISNHQNYFQLLAKFTSHSQKYEYLESWTAGKAAREAVVFIKNNYLISKTTTVNKKPLLIAVRTDAGNPENTLFYSFAGDENIIVNYFDQNTIPNITTFSCLKTDFEIIFVSRDNHFGGTEKFWQEEARFYNNVYADKNEKHQETISYVAVHKPKTDCLGETLVLQ